MKTLVNDAMEMLHEQSLPTIELLQTSFPDKKEFMINISTLFDPRYVFLIYAPILFAINKRVGHRTIIALTLAEWANQVLKWLLAGERPYWYVRERAHERAVAAVNSSASASATIATGIESYDYARLLTAATATTTTGGSSQQLEIKQFPVTCELGAGSPSGHAMVTATVWYILIDAYLRGELPALSRANYSLIEPYSNPIANKLAKLSWSIYTLMLVMVSLSRVYLACHFPHQCLCGALLGVAVARLVAEKLPMERLEKRHFCLATCFMFATALGTYGLLRSLGVNPLWSVDKGMRWCVKKEYIHLDTTPFFSMMRYLGFCLGCGLAYDSSKLLAASARSALLTSSASSASSASQQQQQQQQLQHLLVARRALVAIGSILFGQFLLALPLPKANLNLFYLISFLLYTVFSYAISAPIPRLTKRALDRPPSISISGNNKEKAH